jgi:hypothetical protein
MEFGIKINTMKIIKFKTIGSDPEFAIRKDNINLPSYMFIDSKKGSPKEYESGFGIMKDNLLIEGNIPPASNASGFISNMKLLKGLIETIIRKSGSVLISEDIVSYNKEFIETEDGQEFGCSSYVDAWSITVKKSPELFNTNKRPIGGHIHIGYEIIDEKYNQETINPALARAFDYFLSLPADTVKFCKERRETYGALGSFRDTEYGFEYRSLGGYFMKDEHLKWVYDQSLKAIDFISKEENIEKIMSIKKPSYDHYDFLGIDLNEQVPIINNNEILKQIKQILA